VTEAHTPALLQLQREAHLLHRALFRIDPTPQIVDRYMAAHEAGLGACAPAEAAWLERVFVSGADLLALELSLRRQNPKHVLVRKFLIMTYIAEGSPGYAAHFLSLRRRAAPAWLELGLALLRSAWKLLKGQYLLRRFS
jgi:hypothetical protein